MPTYPNGNPVDGPLHADDEIHGDVPALPPYAAHGGGPAPFDGTLHLKLVNPTFTTFTSDEVAKACQSPKIEHLILHFRDQLLAALLATTPTAHGTTTQEGH